jgi:hypothetical protein
MQGARVPMLDLPHQEVEATLFRFEGTRTFAYTGNK